MGISRQENLLLTMMTIELVKAKYPRATSRRYSGSNDWEVFETEDTETSWLLGSGTAFPCSPEQDEIDYKFTEDAAWDDALRNIRAVEKFGELAKQIMRDNNFLTMFSPDRQRNFISMTARSIYDAQVPEDFRYRAERMRTQDNACTANPIFIVYEKERIYGMDPAYADENIVWIDSGNDYAEADEKKAKALERYYNYFGTEPRNWTRTAYIDCDKFSTVCFTRQGAEDYINAHKHNLKRPHIYVEHLHRRNWEMNSVRSFLEAL